MDSGRGNGGSGWQLVLGRTARVIVILQYGSLLKGGSEVLVAYAGREGADAGGGSRPFFVASECSLWYMFVFECSGCCRSEFVSRACALDAKWRRDRALSIRNGIESTCHGLVFLQEPMLSIRNRFESTCHGAMFLQ